jgi:hypothetical protein
MASNPFGITQVDAPGLLNAYVGLQRQQMQDRMLQANFLRQQKMDERGDAEYEAQQKARGLIAQGASPTDVIKADPATGFAYATHAAQIAQAQRELQAQRAHAVGNAAMFVSRLPPEQQPAAWDSAIDQLAQQGYTDLLPYKGHYDPNALPALIAASAEASAAYLGQSDKDRTYQETVRAHKAEEANRAGHLSLDQQREARITKWGPQPLFGVMPTGDGSDLDAKYGGK